MMKEIKAPEMKGLAHWLGERTMETSAVQWASLRVSSVWTPCLNAVCFILDVYWEWAIKAVFMDPNKKN